MSDDELFGLLPRHGERDRAFAIAARVHSGQRDKAGCSYLLAHVSDVVGRVDEWNDDDVVVAWLHDVVEDCRDEDRDALLAELRESFTPAQVEALLAITFRKGEETRDEYYARVRANPIALRVKLADIASNTDPLRMSLLSEETRERLVAKYAHALEVLSA